MNNRGNAQLIPLLIVALVVIGAGVYYFSQNKTSVTDIPKAAKEAVTGPDLSILNYKSEEEYFPKKIKDLPIITKDEKSVVYIFDKDYKGDTDNSDKKALIDNGFAASYGDEEKLEKVVLVVYRKFSSPDEVKDAKEITDAVFSQLPVGFKKVSFALASGITHWDAYREVPADKASDQASADVRLLFNEPLVMIQFKFAGSYSQKEVEETINAYVDSILNKNTEYIKKDEIVTK